MKLLKDGAIYILGEILSKAMPFLLLPYLTRKLGPAGFGELSYYQAFVAIFIIFISFSQHGAIARYYYVAEKKAINMVVLAGYSLNLAISLALIVFFWIIQSEMLIYVTMIASFQAFLDVQLTLRQCQKQALSYVKIQLFHSFLNVTLTIALLELFTKNLVENRIFAILISVMVAFVISCFIYIKSSKERLKFSKTDYLMGLGYILTFGFPLLLHGISSVIKGHLDKIIIFNNFSQAELGQYSAGLQIASVVSVVIMALNKALMPYYYEALTNKKMTITHVKKFFIYACCFIPFPSLIVYLLPQSLFTLLLGEGYGEVKHYVALFTLAMSILVPYLILVNYLFYHAKNFVISFSSVIGTIIYLILLYYLVTTGIENIPYASIISQLILLPILYFFCHQTSNNEGLKQ